MSTYALLMARKRENISAKTLMALKPQIFSPANLSLSTVHYTTTLASLLVTLQDGGGLMKRPDIKKAEGVPLYSTIKQSILIVFLAV